MKAKLMEKAPYLDSVCIWNEEEDTLTIFAVNKSLDEDMEVSCDLRQFEGYKVVEHIVLTNDDLKAVNTEAAPNTVGSDTLFCYQTGKWQITDRL